MDHSTTQTHTVKCTTSGASPDALDAKNWPSYFSSTRLVPTTGEGTARKTWYRTAAGNSIDTTTMAKMQVLCFLAIWVGLAAALEGPKAPPRHLPELFAMQGSKKSNSREKGYSKTSDTDKRDRKSDSDEEDVYSHPKKNTPRYRGSDSKGKGKGAPKPWPTYSPYPTYSPHPTPPPSVTTSPQSPTYGPKAPDPPPITKGAEPQRSKKKKYGSKSDKGMSKMNKSPGKKVTMPPTTISPTPPPVPLTPTASPAPSAPSTPVPVIETMSPTTAPPGAPTAAPVISQPSKLPLSLH